MIEQRTTRDGQPRRRSGGDQPGDRLDGGEREGGGEHRRSTAEWVSLTISAAIVLTLLGVVVYLYFTQGDQPATILVEPQMSRVREAGGAFYLPVEIKNVGTRTAEDVKVAITHVPAQGERQSAEVTVTFLAGGETQHATFILYSDPRTGRFTAGAVSYREP